MKHIFIIGCKGIPAKYGGFETFVDQLVQGQNNEDIQYYVACMNSNQERMQYKRAICFNVEVANIGSAKAVFYDIKAMEWCINYIRKNDITDAMVYVLACRMGPFFASMCRKLHNLGAYIYLNPDGHEWKRQKWNWFIQRYWKYSERKMIENADKIICDSVNIQKYVINHYKKYNPQTMYLSYGALYNESKIKLSEKNDNNEDALLASYEIWSKQYEVQVNEYYLIVGRFVPENNYEYIIQEFCKSDTNKKLIIITNVEQNKLYRRLEKNTCFQKDPRICFVGTVYDTQLLCEIRKHAFAYLHGHEVGGTNPSLLEALAFTPVNLLLKVEFNEEVGQNAAIYWTKDPGSLRRQMKMVENMTEEQRTELSTRAIQRIKKQYSWKKIIEQYEDLWMEKKK